MSRYQKNSPRSYVKQFNARKNRKYRRWWNRIVNAQIVTYRNSALMPTEHWTNNPIIHEDQQCLLQS